MRYYKTRRKSNGNTRKILFRVLFAVVAAIVILTVTLIIGNHLKNKVNAVTKASPDTQIGTGLQAERHIEETAMYDEYSPTVFGTSLKIADYVSASDGEKVKSIEDDVKMMAEYYDTLTVDLMDGNGDLVYSSPAMCKIAHIPYEDGGKEEELLRSAVASAKKEDMRTCAVILPKLSEMTISGAAAVDGALISELGEMGFDEVLLDLTDVFPAVVDYDTANRVRTYMHECSSITGDVSKLGIVLTAEAFLDPANAKQIQLLANSASFLAIYFDLDEVYITDDAFNTVSDAVTSLLGNFSVYNMRVMIDSRFDLISSAVYVACNSHGVNNVSFSSFILPQDLVYAGLPGTTLPVSDDPEEKNTVSNPYATTADNPSIGAGDKEKTDGEGGTPDNDDGSVRPWY